MEWALNVRLWHTQQLINIAVTLLWLSLINSGLDKASHWSFLNRCTLRPCAWFYVRRGDINRRIIVIIRTQILSVIESHILNINVTLKHYLKSFSNDASTWTSSTLRKVSHATKWLVSSFRWKQDTHAVDRIQGIFVWTLIDKKYTIRLFRYITLWSRTVDSDEIYSFKFLQYAHILPYDSKHYEWCVNLTWV